MAFLTVGKPPGGTDRRLYILEVTIYGEKYLKIGVASGHSAKDRMMQIAGSFFDKYRELPIIKIRRDQKVPEDKCFEYETRLHQFFKAYSHTPVVPFSGSTELFDLCDREDDVIQAYEAVIDGMVPDFAYCTEDDELPF